MSQINRKVSRDQLSTPQLSLAVQYASRVQHLPTRAQLRRWIGIALQHDVRITLRIVDEPEGRELNKNYRGKDYATNVLTFVYDNVKPTPPNLPLSGEESVSPPDRTTSHSTRQSKDNSQVAGYDKGDWGVDSASAPLSLHGDIVICAPVVAQEAAAQHKDLLAHYAHLMIHATLHLQGYQHDDETEAAEMESLETVLMLKLRYPDPYQASCH